VHKVPARELAGGRVAASATLRHAVYMIRCDAPGLALEPVSRDEFRERALDASMRELKTLQEILQLIRANAPGDLRVESATSLAARTASAYGDALARADTYVALVPHAMRPADVVAALEARGLL
jgi:hypothetical protein